MKIRHRRFGDAGAHDIDTRVVIEVLGDQRVAKRFDAIGVDTYPSTAAAANRRIRHIPASALPSNAFDIVTLWCVGLNRSDCMTSAGRGLPVYAPLAATTTMEPRFTSSPGYPRRVR